MALVVDSCQVHWVHSIQDLIHQKLAQARDQGLDLIHLAQDHLGRGPVLADLAHSGLLDQKDRSGFLVWDHLEDLDRLEDLDHLEDLDRLGYSDHQGCLDLLAFLPGAAAAEEEEAVVDLVHQVSPRPLCYFLVAVDCPDFRLVVAHLDGQGGQGGMPMVYYSTIIAEKL